MPVGFSRELLQTVVCQRDGGALAFAGPSSVTDPLVEEADVQCQSCRTTYEIRDGILNLLPKQAALTDAMSQERAARDMQSDRYDARLGARHRREIVPTFEAAGCIKEKTIIEYGCGTGRLTIHLTGARVLAVDFSRESLRRAADKLRSRTDVGLVQADIVQLRVRQRSFDVALAAQVYEHLPSAEVRRQFLSGVASGLADGGAFVSSVYHFDIWRRLLRLPREGFHASGIYYRFFSRSEIERDIGRHFAVDSIRYVDLNVPMARRLRLDTERFWRIAADSPLLGQFAHLLVVVAHNPRLPAPSQAE